MSNIVDRVFSEVCLDERVSDGIFKMEEEAHMDALRDYFVKKGITKEAAIHVTNRMVEGKYPDRQAYRKEDGILVTWPSPKHKAKAMQENPGKYIEQDPMPKQHEPVPDPVKKEPRADKPPTEKEVPTKPDDEEKEKSLPRSSGGSNLFGGDKKVDQGGKELAVEPPRGNEKPEPIAPAPTVAPPVPRTPERVAAEKEVVQQIFATSNNSLSNIEPPLNEVCRFQLNELYKKADELGFKEAVTFLTPYVKP